MTSSFKNRLFITIDKINHQQFNYLYNNPTCGDAWR